MAWMVVRPEHRGTTAGNLQRGLVIPTQQCPAGLKILGGHLHPDIAEGVEVPTDHLHQGLVWQKWLNSGGPQLAGHQIRLDERGAFDQRHKIPLLILRRKGRRFKFQPRWSGGRILAIG